MAHIAVIDSQENFRTIWKPVLEAQGHTCSVHNDTSVLGALGRSPDAIISHYDYQPLLEIMLPNGKTSAGLREVPLIVVSSRNHQAAQRHASEAGAAFIPMLNDSAALSWLLRFALCHTTSAYRRRTLAAV